MNKYIFTLFLFFFCLKSFSRSYDIQKIGLDHGISNNYIMGITQDKKGFLWFSTESGLNRFDGNEFRIYKKSNSNKTNTISGNELNVVYADKYDDIIWIATQRDGLNAFDYNTETFTQYKSDQSNPHGIITNDITNIVNSSDGNIWITTYHQGFDYFDKQTKKFKHYNTKTLPGLISNGIWSLAEDKNKTLYIGHVDAGLSIISKDNKSIKNFKSNLNDLKSLPGNRVNVVFIDNNQNLWVGTNNGLALFNPTTENFTVFKHDPNNRQSLVSNTILSITQLNDGNLWVGTENGGISILNIQQSMFLMPNSIKFDNIYPGDNNQSLSNKTIRSIFQDSFNNIWIGTYGDGINFISHRQPLFENWSYSPIPGVANSLSGKTVWGICVDNLNQLWVGTDGNGIDIFDDGNKIRTYNSYNSNLTDNAILAAFRDSQNNLWFGTFSGGVNIFDHKSKIFKSIPITNSNDIRCFAEDNDHNIWIGSGKGIYIYNLNNQEIKNVNSKNSALREDLIRSILFDNKGRIWIGSFGGGLSVYDSQMNLIDFFNTTKGFPSNTINHIFKDKNNDIWIGTGNGLVFFKSKKDISSYTVFNENNGIKSSHIRAITDDDNGNIWFSTNSDISQYALKQKKFYNYSYYDGIPLGDFMSGSVSKMTDGSIYFGSHNGLCFFYPKNITQRISIPPVVITTFILYDKNTELSKNELNKPIVDNIKLRYSQNTFKISFNILDYSLNNLVEYSYRLKGLEDSWYSTNNENSIMFRNIPPGTYKLLIKARIKNQEWSDQVTSMTITIEPPFWLTWGAKFIYILIIVIFILWIARFYKRRVELENSLLYEKINHKKEQELNNERLRFFTNITHELRTPLTLILGPLEDLSVDSSLSEKHAKKISVIYKSATRLLNLVNQILEFRKTETQNKKLSVKKDNLASLIQEVSLKYKELNTKEGLSFETKIADGNYEIYYDQDVIATILENLMSNAIKYTESGSIVLSIENVIEHDIEYTQITVKDTGRGIQAESINKIFDRYYQEQNNFQKSGTGIGLALVNNLAILHEGEVLVESEIGIGTEFRFKIISNNTYPNAIHKYNNEEKKEPETFDEIDEVQTSKPIILVVEDDEEINEYITNSLSAEYIVYSALNGKDGLEKASIYIPDIIISDIMMPEMDGFNLTRTLKADIRTSHIPIILLTAKDNIQDRTEGYSIGAESYITKPFSASLLRARIKNLFDTRRKIAEQIQTDTSNSEKSTVVTNSLNELDKEFIEKITDIIEENIDSESLDVNFIADKIFMSHSTLYRKIKALTDMTINEFIRKIRMKLAEELLLSGKYSISEISYMVGINSVTYFRQCFKDQFGLAPTEYLKKIRGE